MTEEQREKLLLQSITQIVRIDHDVHALAGGLDAAISGVSCEPIGQDLNATAADLRVRANQASEISRKLSEQAGRIEMIASCEVADDLPAPLPSPPAPAKRLAKSRARRAR